MTPNHEYPLRIPKDLWSDLTAIKKISDLFAATSKLVTTSKQVTPQLVIE